MGATFADWRDARGVAHAVKLLVRVCFNASLTACPSGRALAFGRLSLRESAVGFTSTKRKRVNPRRDVVDEVTSPCDLV